MTFIGIVELSRFVSAHHRVARAARDGARVGSITIEGPDADGSVITANAIDQAQTVLAANCVACKDSCDVSADWLESDGDYYVTVTVTSPHRSLTGFFPSIQDGITASFTMMTQQQ